MGWAIAPTSSPTLISMRSTKEESHKQTQPERQRHDVLRSDSRLLNSVSQILAHRPPCHVRRLMTLCIVHPWARSCSICSSDLPEVSGMRRTRPRR